MLTILKGVSWTPVKPSSAPPAVLTSIQLVYFQCLRCSWGVCECVMLLFFCIFLCKAMWSTAHGYHSAGAGHSVAIKQFNTSSRTYEERDLFINKNICYSKHIYTTLMLHTGIRNINIKFLHDMLVNWLYGSIRSLLFLWWTITVEAVLYRKTTCL